MEIIITGSTSRNKLRIYTNIVKLQKVISIIYKLRQMHAHVHQKAKRH